MCKGLLVIVHVRGPQVKGGILFSSFQNVFTKVPPIGTKLQVAACFTRHADITGGKTAFICYSKTENIMKT